MKQFLGVLGAVVTVLAVAVPIGLADGGGTTGDPPKAKPAVVCAGTAFAATIVRVGGDAVTARLESGKPLVVRLTDETVVRQGDTVVDRSELAAGKRARFIVRFCRSEERRVITAKVIILARAGGVGTGDTQNPPPATEPEPKPVPKPEVCGQGEMNTVLVAVSSSSIMVRTTSAEGTKEWAVAVSGETVVRKNDENVSLSSLKDGDLVHVVLIRCPSGSVRALRIVFLRGAEIPA